MAGPSLIFTTTGFVERMIICNRRKLVIMTVAVCKTYERVSAVWSLNRVHPDSIEIGNVCVATSVAPNLTYDRVNRANGILVRVIEVLARCPV
jgi:hypothetical protein